MTKKLEELETIRSDLQGNMKLIIRTDDGEFNWDYGSELLEELLDDEIERLSVTDDTLWQAIQEMSQLYQVIQDKYSFDESKRRTVKLAIEALKAYKPITGETSDGYHTFNELYEHRTALFAALCNTYNDRSWKSFKHADGSMYDGMFIAGIETPKGQYTYHCDEEYLYMFAMTREVPNAPEWDGHKPSDYNRLFTMRIESKQKEPVRKSRTTEPVGESEPCYMCKQIEDKYETEVIIRYGFGDYEDFTPDYCPNCGRKL